MGFLFGISIPNCTSQEFYPIAPNQDTIRIYSFYKDTITNETFIGGDFHEFAGVSANNIIKWTGSQWLPVGDGFNKPVHAITKYKGSLVAAGEFDSSGTTKFLMPIARWDGVNWNYFDNVTQVVHPFWPNPWTPVIYDVEEFDNRLFVLGEIRHSGPFPGTNNFYDFAVWNDTIWKPAVLPSGPALEVQLGINLPDMIVFQNDLYLSNALGADYCQTSPQQGTNVFGLIRYNSACLSVEQIGTGWQNTLASSVYVYNNSLYVGMYFPHPQYGNFATRYDGVNFYPIGNGFNDRVYNFMEYNGQICAVGRFTGDGTNTQSYPNHIASWDGTTWNALPASCSMTGAVVFRAGVIDSTMFIDGGLFYCGSNYLSLAATYPHSLTGNNDLTDITENHFSIFPNPASDKITLTCIIRSNITGVKMHISDLSGRIISLHQIQESFNNQEIDISHLSNGSYIVNFEYKGSILASRKLMVVK